MEAFEGNRDIFKTMGEKAKKLSKVALTKAKKAVGLHVGEVTEANPIYYIVVASQGAMVRKGIELDSASVYGLRQGDLVTCVDLSGRRARIIDPVEGWVSTRTGDNELILEPTIAPEKHIQVSLMEKRFEKLKAEQRQQCDDQDKAIPAPGQNTALPETAVRESDFVSVNAIKEKLTFKSTGSSDPLGKSTIPKLSGPGVKRTIQASPEDLFNLDPPKNVKLPDPSFIEPKQNHQPINTYVDPFADLLSSPCGASVGLRQPQQQNNTYDWFN